MTPRRSQKPLADWRVLVPRGGEWGNNIASVLRKSGATAVIAPMTNFASTHNSDELAGSLAKLEGGFFEWLVVTSSTVVDVLAGHSVLVPAATRIAAIGELTASSLLLAGYRIDFTPENDNSIRGLLKEWSTVSPDGVVLVPQAEDANEELSLGFANLGVNAEFVTAYRTVGVPVPADVARDVASGAIRGILITSGSVARQVEQQLAPLPDDTVVVAIGPRTAFDAREAGIVVDAIAESRTGEALVEALIEQSIR